MQFISVKYTSVINISIFLCSCRRFSTVYKLRIFRNRIFIFWNARIIIINIIAPVCLNSSPVTYRSRSCFFSIIIENIVINITLSSGHTIYRNVFFHIENIVVNFSIWITGKIQYTSQIILTDIITENSIHRLSKTEHNTAPCIVRRIIILINTIIPRIRIPCLTVLAQIRVIALIILE